MRENQVKEVFEKVRSELESLEIPISTHIDSIRVNPRPKKRLGVCRAEKRQGKAISYTIELSEILLKCDEQAICTVIAHELLHTCPGCLNHGKKWKSYGRKVQEHTGYVITTTANYRDLGLPEQDREEKSKYIIECPVCGYVYSRKRMCPLLKNPERYKCGKCGANLAGSLKSTTSCR